MRPWPRLLVVCSGGKRPSREGFHGGLDSGLVAFQREEVVAVVVINNVASVLCVGVRSVSGDDFAVEITDLVKERPERQVLGSAVWYLGLSDHCTVVVEQPGEQFDLLTCMSGGAT